MIDAHRLNARGAYGERLVGAQLEVVAQHGNGGGASFGKAVEIDVVGTSPDPSEGGEGLAEHGYRLFTGSNDDGFGLSLQEVARGGVDESCRDCSLELPAAAVADLQGENLPRPLRKRGGPAGIRLAN